jgi:hypothetical protein
MKQILTRPEMAKTLDNTAEPVILLKRIGSTTYKVSVRFSRDTTETMETKLLKLIEREVSKNA